MEDMYHYVESGLDNVWLSGVGIVRKETPYGETVAIKNVEQLHRLIGMSIVQNTDHIGAQEVRFLRHELNWSQSQLAKTLDVKEGTVGRWERGETLIQGPAKVALCLLYTGFCEESKVAELVKEIASLDRQLTASRHSFCMDDNNDWRRDTIAA